MACACLSLLYVVSCESSFLAACPVSMDKLEGAADPKVNTSATLNGMKTASSIIMLLQQANSCACHMGMATSTLQQANSHACYMHMTISTRCLKHSMAVTKRTA